MNRLAIISTTLGAVLMLGRLPGIFSPEKFRAFHIKFPRAVWPGRILMAIAAFWAGIVVYGAATAALHETLLETGRGGIWAILPTVVVIGFPIAYWLVIQFGNQYLALRGAAALLLLVAKQMVDAADTSELPARLVVTVVAYVWVIAAIWMTIAPHHFRDLIGYFMANNSRCRLVCSLGIVVGATLLGLGMFVY
jgi:hypothetical protein